MKRRTAREEAFKILFQIDVNDENNLVQENLPSFTKQLVEGYLENREKIDRIIKDHLENWSIDRIARVEKTILRIATYEMTFLDDIPHGVSINEAVELANKYGDEKSGKFVNGVLAKMIKS